MQLKDAKVGDHILVYCDGFQCLTVDTTCETVQAIVLAHSFYGISKIHTTILGWKAGENHTTSTYDYPLQPYWVSQGFVLAHEYCDDAPCLPGQPTIMVDISFRKEAPCKQCSRMNDMGVKKCWSCECLSPNG